MKNLKSIHTCNTQNLDIKVDKKGSLIYSNISYDGTPLDFSNLEIKDLSSITKEEPRDGIRKSINQKQSKLQKNSIIPENPKLQKTKTLKEEIKNQKSYKNPQKKQTLKIKPLSNLKNLINTYNTTLTNTKDLKDTRTEKTNRKKKKIKLITTSLLLGYNFIRNIKQMDSILEKVMYNPITNLRWLDLQHNYLINLDNCITKFENLKCLYLHCNFIFDINEFRKLENLKNLRVLTVHNNPLVKIPNFRLCFISIFKSLKKLDTVVVTAKERDNARVWIETFKKKKYPAYGKIDCRKPPVEEVLGKNQDD